MKAKAIQKVKKIAKKPKSKVQNEEPIQPLSHEEIVKELENAHKNIVNSNNYSEYLQGWADWDKYKLMKDNYKK